ncbi:class I SAM-dependent methyltransferase, partial [Agrobacterium vitis]|nr:class I SAM-dependent methyltransferase [Agrobacterium vitis]MCM2471859.1 class I SAM-dependent methyltransferase [Agrobacterium vitis]MUO73543.1 class I SAM-dependent methyltransferase [Agrobacterium vitis]
MAHDDPFAVDLFGNTALASGFDLSLTGFAADFGTDIDIDPQPSTLAPAAPVRKEPKPKTQMRAKVDFRLQGSRGLAKSWRDRARDNITAILLANEIERQGLPARPDQQARLIKFTGFGASDLANGIFRRPGDEAFRNGWEELGGNLESAVAPGDYASLARCTQY